MGYFIALPDSVREQLKDPAYMRYIRIRIEPDGQDVNIFPIDLSCSALGDYQKWRISLKNRGAYEEGMYAGAAAAVEISTDDLSWYRIWTGFVSDDGCRRSIGFTSDDQISFDLVDPTTRSGTKSTPDAALLVNCTIADPLNPQSSILHIIAGKMGITEFDTAFIPYVKPVVEIGSKTAWKELQLLAESFHADMYYDHLGRLRFRSPLEQGYIAPTPEWVFCGDPKSSVSGYASRIKGTVEISYLPVQCNKATSKIKIYEQLSQRVIYKNTDNFDDALDQCLIEIEPGECWPGPVETDIAQLEYKDPTTGESYPYADDVISPVISSSASSADILYDGGALTMLSFNGSDECTTLNPGSSEIILKNTGGSTCRIRKLTIRGIPYKQSKEQLVEYADSAIVDESLYVDQDIDGKYAVSSDQIYQTLYRRVQEGKQRVRQFSFATSFLPQVQRKALVWVQLPGSDPVRCRVDTYNHTRQGKTLASMTTQVVCTELEVFIPSGSPKVITSDTPNHIDGARSLYNWIMYADDELGTGMSDDSMGKSYLGIAYNKETSIPSENPADYTWSKYLGPRGEDGLTTYFHVKYADDVNGTNMNETGGDYIGTYVDHTSADSSDPTDYIWVLVKGAQGPQGDQGIAGIDGSDGSTAYLHIKYSDDGGSSFTGNGGEDPGQWIGQYTDHTSGDSTSVGSYTWTKVKGEAGVDGEYTEFQYAKNTSESSPPSVGWQSTQPTLGDYEFLWMQSRIVDSYGIAGAWTLAVRISGVPGVPGVPGNDANSLYTWVAFASDDRGTDISTTYTEGLHTHIGHAYNKSNSTPDITSPLLYEWTPFYAHLIATKIQITPEGAIYSGYSANGEAPVDGKGFFLGNGVIKAKDGEFTGTFRSGEGADPGARFAARESIGVGEIQHTGGTQNDLFTPTEGDVSVNLIEVQISQINIQHTYQVEHIYQIGDIGPEGGYIFYDKGNWQGGWRYIETAPDNWYGTSPPDIRLPLSEYGLSPPTTPTYSREIGDAETNFTNLKSFLGSTAAIQAIDLLTAGGKSDWVIPTGDELGLMWNLLWRNQTGIWGPPSYYATDMWNIVYFSSSLYADSELPNFTTIEAYIFDSYSQYVTRGSSMDSSGNWTAEDENTYTKPIRYVKEILYDTFTYYQDAFKWRANSGTWSTQQEIVSGLSFSLGYGGLSIAFGNPTGHTMGETWSFSQGNLFGLSIKDSAGNEYLKAINGQFLFNGNGVLTEKTLNGYPGFVHVDGSDSNYLRTTKNGIIPYQSGGSGYVGTSGWPFSQIWGNYVRGAVGNDFADFIETPLGWKYGYAHVVDGIYYGIPSDTASFFAGREGEHKMPRAVVGFVLVYTDCTYPVNTKLTYRADGVLTKKQWWMRRPVIATYYQCPGDKTWNDVTVSGRHIVKVVF